jgi:RNA polymerase sigma-70 factor (ECF subfamily)
MQLFHEHKARVHHILYRVLGSNRDVEDLIQETFLEVFRSLPRYRGDARLGTWISKICTRVAFAYLKKRRPIAVELDEAGPLPEEGPGSDDIAVAREATRRLYLVLSKLDPKYRIAFAMHVIDGRKMQEVAEMTDSTTVATKSRVWRARREIEKCAKRDPLLASYLAGQEAGA